MTDLSDYKPGGKKILKGPRRRNDSIIHKKLLVFSTEEIEKLEKEAVKTGQVNMNGSVKIGPLIKFLLKKHKYI